MAEQADRVKPAYVLYNREGAPFEVYGLAAFCREHGLPLQAMKNVVYGKTRQYRGWHPDEARTQRLEVLAKQIEAWFAESEEKYGVAFTIEIGE